MIPGSRQEVDQRERERRKVMTMPQGERSPVVLYVDKLPENPTPGIEHRQVIHIEGDPSKEITDEKLILLDRRIRDISRLTGT